MNSIELYEHVATASGEPLAVALRELSEESGMVVSHSVWSRWRRGERTPPADVLRTINRTIVGRALREAGLDEPLDDAVLDQLADSLSPPPRVR